MYTAKFTIEDILYLTAEHYMMAAKAKLFKDDYIFQQVIKADNPGLAKSLGRQVSGFSEKIWLEHRFKIICDANRAKFRQNLNLQEFLLGTGNKILVEASPADTIWGIGLAERDPQACNPNLWKGLNLLGFALMHIRTELAHTKNNYAIN